MTFGLALVACAGVALGALRLVDHRADSALVADLTAADGRTVPAFSPAMVADLPEPAARFFLFAMAPGTPLRTRAAIEMTGELSLGPKDDPGYREMHARQVLAPPSGFVWQVGLAGPISVTGSDAYRVEGSWSRFRLLHLIPFGRVSHDPDHLRSAFGRMVGEGLFWTPAAFLPMARAGWDEIRSETVSADTAAVIVRHDGLEQRAEVTVDGTGQPVRVVFPRWSNENSARVYREQPFGGDLSEIRSFDGFRLPTRVFGGNFYGTEAYHPFFRATVTALSFP